MHRILMVEDSLMFQRFLQARLQQYGDKFVAILASNGEEAIRILQKKKISLVVTDIQMPKLDGLALLTYIHENYPELPCIAMSGCVSLEMEAALSKYSIRFFRKPFPIEELAQAVIHLLDPNAPEGKVLGISAASFMQLIGIEEKTCLMLVASPDGREGTLYFQDGEVYDARLGELSGEAAVYALMAMDRATIQLKNLPSGGITRRIHGKLIGLIMEGMRRKDEAKAAFNPAVGM